MATPYEKTTLDTLRKELMGALGCLDREGEGFVDPNALKVLLHMSTQCDFRVCQMLLRCSGEAQMADEEVRSNVGQSNGLSQ